MEQYNSTWYFRAMYVQGRIFNWQQKKVCSSGYLVQWLSLKRSTSLQISSWSKQSYSALQSRFKNKALTEKKKKRKWIYISNFMPFRLCEQTCDLLLNSLTNDSGHNPSGKGDSGYLTKPEVCRWQKALSRCSQVTLHKWSISIKCEKKTDFMIRNSPSLTQRIKKNLAIH